MERGDCWKFGSSICCLRGWGNWLYLWFSQEPNVVRVVRIQIWTRRSSLRLRVVLRFFWWREKTVRSFDLCLKGWGNWLYLWFSPELNVLRAVRIQIWTRRSSFKSGTNLPDGIYLTVPHNSSSVVIVSLKYLDTLGNWTESECSSQSLQHIVVEV